MSEGGAVVLKAYNLFKTAIGYLIAYGVLFWLFVWGVKIAAVFLRFIGFTI